MCKCKNCDINIFEIKLRKGGVFVENMNKDVKTVLIVDDEQAIIDVLKFNLLKEGYRTIEAKDG